MAIDDIYALRWRTEQDGVVMNNGIIYQQTEDITGPGSQNGAVRLLEAMSAANNGVTKYWQQFASTSARITCAIVEKLYDESGSGDEQALDANLAWTGAGVQPAAPSQQWCLNLWATKTPGEGLLSRNLYLGGLDETAWPTFGNFVIQAWFQLAVNNQTWLLRPTINGIQQPFTAVLPMPTPPGQAPQNWRAISRVNPSFWLSRKNSRRLRICV